MSQLVPLTTPYNLPVLITAAGEQASTQLLEFSVDIIRNVYTRRAYARAVGLLLTWCEGIGVPSIAAARVATEEGS